MGYFIPFAILVCVLATLMTKFALAIKDKARLPDGVVGGILIGAITSIPELITSICVVVQSTTDTEVHASSVFGDVIGSNMFCMLIMSVVLIGTVVLFKHREANQINTVSLTFMVIGTIFCFVACIFDNNGPIYNPDIAIPSPLVWNGFNFFSIFIFASYGIAVYSMIFGSKVVSAGVTGKGLKTKVKLPAVQKHEPSKFLQLPMWSLILLLVGSVVALTLSSLVLAASCGGLIVRWELPQVFGRTLLLGVATSLPELVAVVNLAINRRYNMVIDSMVGSCAFNMTILFLSNMIYGCIATNPVGDPMFVLNDKGDTAVQLSLFLLQCLFVLIYLVINSRSVKSYLSNRQAITINAVLLGLSVLPYISYITLGILEQNGIIPY